MNRIAKLFQKFYSISALPFYFGWASIQKIFFAYHPDSYNSFKAHSEFKLLFEKFTAHNQLNNAGDTARLWSFILNIKQVMSENIAGDFAELGVWRGNTASILAHYAKGHGRKVFLFDTFEGFDAKDLGGIDADKTKEFQDTSLNLAKSVIAPNDGVCEFIKGYFPDSVTDSCKGSTFSIVSLDCDLYEPTKAGLEFFYPRMQTGGIFLLHDYSSLWWTGSKKAIDDFCKNNKEFIVLMPDKSGSAFFRKTK